MTPLTALLVIALLLLALVPRSAQASFPVDPRMCPKTYPQVQPCGADGNLCHQIGSCAVMARDVVRGLRAPPR